MPRSENVTSQSGQLCRLQTSASFDDWTKFSTVTSCRGTTGKLFRGSKVGGFIEVSREKLPESVHLKTLTVYPTAKYLSVTVCVT
ncbi:hypothetical protein LMH87_002253 [Akanthomyces muscarius]|uniref:Uncharacterized protein n=1 Tax=Akanthomyces muscarius TaxID=2231603 RepID=A0A9W8Q6Q7_AKAMU|nr:hypothetical protein LMH87_002253 [Akanthomyces muscarius]KAJ4147747.1 hypothetical protein LMH87_002253 [Akanthomyces muscarius]